MLPRYRRIATSRSQLWTDVAIEYWLFDFRSNVYSMMPPVMQTGEVGPRVRLGLQRLFLGGSYMRGITWFEAQGGMDDSGVGPASRTELHAGLDLHRDLNIVGGYYCFETTFVTEHMGIQGMGRFEGWFGSLQHSFPLTSDTRHGLRYHLDYFPFFTMTKGTSLAGYETLSLPEVTEKALALRMGLEYSYALQVPVELNLGMNFEYFNAKQDVTVFVGPSMSLIVKL
ncbi:MAG: hypothetical protein A2284_16660 [Deltaproteobacteria bacterium RIFOXYA12_FULL_61_11]|nr:MAG: hypothetical protein A2284_16660 [Deltaproteobacteria bacterium RIFOXYA12_FULL_61_11]